MNINIWYIINFKILNISIKMIVFEKWIKIFIIKIYIKMKVLLVVVYNKNFVENVCINSEYYMYLIY